MNALILEGGGAKGAYEVGAVRALYDCGYHFDCVLGASIGSFNGALIASHQLDKLEEFWKNVDVGKILNLNEETINALNNKTINMSLINDILDIIKNEGIDLNALRKTLDEMINEDDVRNSDIDFGLVTVKRKNMEPVEIFIKDIPKNKLNEYINASCYLPGFKKDKIIDDNYYFDGGFHDVCPVNMALKAGYDNIIAIRVKGIGRFKRVTSNIANITYIEPSRILGNIFTMDKESISENIKIGYYDTIRLIKHYDGYKYTFINKSERYYKFITRKISKLEYRRVKAFFNTENYKDTVIRALEFVLEKEHINYYEIKHPIKEINSIKNNCKDNEHFIYEFIKKIKFI